ncbi:ubiquitin-conjugating enzyme E2-binding protein [Dimargaris cristalligena]|uniref:Ubiquitin-conjugating enzyme E2-binding protein n=1 Tax=Dimargaris cristalligena TaxID=215637 RepID=A0A4P9ZN69_9FUNG|nr:ubiquitin-conjugating enzyme E2-binding protein [Dimargaris cristalligena]|eukprot:RKP34713.1 ubiquitin-conjugating enzyme E2-binding protein [Dimargaris cristalligena]
MEPPLTAAQLHERATGIQCRWCLQLLVTPGAQEVGGDDHPASASDPTFTALNLPSEHWSELLDCWMCHPDEEFKYFMKYDRDTSLPGFRVHSWHPKLAQVMVGNTYLLVGSRDVPDGAYSVQGRSNPLDKNTMLYENHEEICCKRCLAPIGQRWKPAVPAANSTDYSPLQDEYTIMLFKYATEIALKERKETIRLPLSSALVADLVEMGKAHANYRFCLFSHGQRQPVALLWLLQWNLAVTTNAYHGMVHTLPFSAFDHTWSQLQSFGEQLTNVLKVCYLDQSSDPETFKRHCSQWATRNDVESLFYAETQCQEVMTLLRLSTLAIPPENRQFTEFSVGIIPVG